MKSTKFATKAVHAGVEPDPTTGAIMTPIYQTSTFVQDGPGIHKGFEYSRAQNPTRFALEACLAALEDGAHAYTFGSGLAAIDALMKLLRPGDEVVCTNDLYGGSYRLFTRIYENFGFKFHFVDMTDANNIRPYLNERTKLVWIETPTNPLMRIVDIEAVCKIAKNYSSKLLVGVDNTFASPYLQQPLCLGADVVMHSITKYLGGHSDVIMGALMVKDSTLAEQLKFIQFACGAVPGPQDCFLVLRGVKTLHLRMDAHGRNASAMAQALDKHPKLSGLYYPGLSTHPSHEIAKKQMRNFGGMISLRLAQEGIEAAARFMRKLEVFAMAESLGGVESLCNHPASMTHASIPKPEREKIGITDSLIRLSVGIEDGEDLINDVLQALEAV